MNIIFQSFAKKSALPLSLLITRSCVHSLTSALSASSFSPSVSTSSALSAFQQPHYSIGCQHRRSNDRRRVHFLAADFSRLSTFEMSRRSSRASAAAASAKISKVANDDDNDNEDVDEPEVEKGTEGKKSTPKKKRASNGSTKKSTKDSTTESDNEEKASAPKKKKTLKGSTKKSTSATDDSSNDDDENQTKSKKKSKTSPKKRKSKSTENTSSEENGASTTTTSTTSTTSTIPSEETSKSPTKKAKKADHQRWTERTPLPKLWNPQQATSTKGSYTFTIISWNVAGLRAVVKKYPDALSNLANKYQADVICLQETKLQEGHIDDPKLKLRESLLEKEGYEGHFSYSLEKKGYSGTAMFIKRRGSGDGDEKSKEGDGSKKGKKQAKLGAFFGTAKKSKGGGDATSKEEVMSSAESTGDIPISTLQPIKVSTELGMPTHDGEGRVITAEFPLFYLTNVYVPNSGQKLDRLTYRTQQWDTDFLSKMQQLEKEGNKPVIWLGDLNVAHNEKDTWNEGAKHLAKSAGTTPEERASFEKQLSEGYIDVFRHLHPEGRGHYSYWSQRAGNREPNKGLRLDYFICSKDMTEEHSDGGRSKAIVRDSYMIHDELGSDHCPIVLEIEIMK